MAAPVCRCNAEPLYTRISVEQDQTITVVIPTLDEARALPDCLKSVGSEDGIEIVVSDGGSSDGTVAIAQAYGGVRVVRDASGRGPQMNRGARAADTSLVVFLHADCRLPEGWLAAIRHALADPGAALCCFRLHTEPSDGGPSGALRRRWLRLLDMRSRLRVLPYGDQGFGMRRHLFDELGGYPDIPLMEDVELASRCRRHGRIVRIPLEMRTTARRFERNPLRTRLMTATFPLLFRLGVSPWRLARWYGSES